MRRTSTRNYRQWGCIGFNGGGSDTSRVPHGEPYAGKLHVRFDEGAGVPHGASRSTLHPFDIETTPRAARAFVVPVSLCCFSEMNQV